MSDSDISILEMIERSVTEGPAVKDPNATGLVPSSLKYHLPEFEPSLPE